MYALRHSMNVAGAGASDQSSEARLTISFFAPHLIKMKYSHSIWYSETCWECLKTTTSHVYKRNRGSMSTEKKLRLTQREKNATAKNTELNRG